MVNIKNFKSWMKATNAEVRDFVQKSMPQNGLYERLCRGEKLKIKV